MASAFPTMTEVKPGIFQADDNDKIMFVNLTEFMKCHNISGGNETRAVIYAHLCKTLCIDGTELTLIEDNENHGSELHGEVEL